MNKVLTCTFIKKLFLLSSIALFAVTHIFAQAPGPVINTFSPMSGPVGTSVTITGTGFNASAANNIVFFGATMATVTTASTTSLTVVVPVGATYQPISVLNGSTALVGYSAKPFVTTLTTQKGSITTTDFMPQVAFGTAEGGHYIVIADIDGDGKPDLVVPGYDNNTVAIFRNTSTSGSITSGSFAPAVDFATGNTPYTVAVGDLDGDGKPDVVLACISSNTVSILRNTSTTGAITASSFAAHVELADLYSPVGIAISDLDGDGKPDLVVSNIAAGASVSVWRNTSTGGSITASSFAARVDLVTSTTTDHDWIAVSDMDGDGKPDLVVSNSQDNTVSVFRNTSTMGSINNINSFAAPVDFATGNTPLFLAIGDLDGDGKPDLAVANISDNTVSILRNTSTPGSIVTSSFAAHVDFATGYIPWVVAIGDLDGDGKPDLVIANGNYGYNQKGNSISIWRNTSAIGSITTSSFAPKIDIPIGNDPAGVAIGDLDGDGKADIALSSDFGNATYGTVSVIRNNPVFAPPTIQATNITFANIAANSATGHWTNGNGSSRAVFIAAASTGSPLPVNDTAYAASTIFGSGAQIGSSGWYCVYNGTDTIVNITGLKPKVTYRVMTVEYNGGIKSENYLTSTSTGNPANVTTTASNVCTLADLTTSSGIFNPGFASAITNYTTSVTNTTSALTITPTPTDPNATVTVNGVATTSGSASAAIPLSVGANTITTVVTAQDCKTTSTYKIFVNRNGPITGLLALKLSTGTINPSFSSTVTDYKVTVSNNTALIIITPTASDPSASITVDGIDVPSGSPSADLPLSVGVNTFTVIVTNGTSSKTYTVAVTRLASDYAYLANLTLSSGTLSPHFASATLTYTAHVAGAIYIAVTPTTVYSFETIKMNGLPIASGTPSSLIPLMDGINNISVVVTAQNGIHTRTYTIIVIKEPGGARAFYQPANLNSAPINSLSAVNGVKVHPGVSPNGDGVNDILMIEGIDVYPENKLRIIDRNGLLVYETEGYNNSSRVFDGHSSKNGAMQAPGTYYYSLQYTDGNEKKYSTGFFILKY